MSTETKKIYIGSTSFDLKDVRAEICRFLEEECGHKPIYFESPDFPSQKLHSHDICIEAVKGGDVFLLIIDSRYGGRYIGDKYPQYKKYNGTDMSITWAETACAYNKDIPVYTFVRVEVWDERPIYKKWKKEGKEYEPPFHVEDIRVFDFIDFIVHQPKCNWIEPFKNVVDLKNKITSKLQLHPQYEIIEEYSSRNIKKVTELLSKAIEEISILGVVSWQPIHEARLAITDLINNHNGKVRILIADPNSEYFRKRAEREDNAKKRLFQEYKSTIAELEKILSKIKPEKRGELILREYKDLGGDISLQIVDNKEMYVNERLPIKGVRAYESPMYKVKREILAHRITFEHFSKVFEDTWDNKSTREVDLITTIANES